MVWVIQGIVTDFYADLKSARVAQTMGMEVSEAFMPFYLAPFTFRSTS